MKTKTSLIERRIGIDMGHRVPNHKSKCNSLHGHFYNIFVGVDDKVITTPGTSDEGMVIDFSDLKQIMMEEIDAKFDHGFCMYKKDVFAPIFKVLKLGGSIAGYLIKDYKPQKIIFIDTIPTAENLAELWYNLIKLKLEEKGIKIKYVKVYETANCCATHEEKENECNCN